MSDYKYVELFLEDSVDKQLTLAFSNGETITNEDIYSESMELTESLCSESELTFGTCETSVFKIKIANSFISHIGETLTVSMTLGGNTDEPFVFGTYTVVSDKPTADRKNREITAYDSMYDIINSEVSDWYNSILPDSGTTVTLKEFRDSFFDYFGIEQEEVTLINDSMTVEQTITPSELSGKDVITAICEINGCFGHIGRDGKFQYIHLLELVEGLYPADDLYPDDDLYPSDSGNSEEISKSHYISCTYEDFTTSKIGKLQIRQEENDVGCIYGDGDNTYIMQDNFLVYGKGADELNTIAENMYSVIHNVAYRPADIVAIGNPCIPIGTGIRLNTTYEIVYTYILDRTLSGIQALRDTYASSGVEKYSEQVNSVQTSIVQLKGKTNTLTRNVEETKQQIADVEEGLSTEITQTAESIMLSASETYETKEDAEATEKDLQAQINLTVKGIDLTVSNGDSTAGITITIENSDGSTYTTNGEVNMTGLVTFTDLSTSGKTTINGANVTIGGEENGDGELIVKDNSGSALITLNNEGITLSDGTSLITSSGVCGDLTYATSGTPSDLGFTGSLYTLGIQTREVYLQAMIPDNYVITSAYLTLSTIGTWWSSVMDASGDSLVYNSAYGYPRGIKAYYGTGQVVKVATWDGEYSYQDASTMTQLVSGGFTSSGVDGTSSITTPKTITSGNIKSVLSTGLNFFKFTPASYSGTTDLSYAQRTGTAIAILSIKGYTKNS